MLCRVCTPARTFVRMASSWAAMAAQLPRAVTLVEVGPRDGLQNEAVPISVASKVELIAGLKDAGLGVIEVGAFVSAKKVPQMASSEEVLRQALRLPGPPARYPVLTPNIQGFEAARAAGATEVAVFTAASETFSQRNTNASIEDSFARIRDITAAAVAAGVRVRGYTSCVLGCPYEGSIDPEKVAQIVRRLLDMGCYEVSLGDTIGVGSAGTTARLLDRVLRVAPPSKLAVHFHDTYGQALTNILVALQHGIATVDSSVAGLGGCPFAAGATGNVATEDVVYLLDGLGISHGVDLQRLVRVGVSICTQLGHPTRSRTGHALLHRPVSSSSSADGSARPRCQSSNT